ncbi:MAG TPA: FG-GAP-like repeat-containing protein [Lentimicrobium sp.]|nr:FG-GAP-like repeat-containing protein [Lentimicrobium sp.]
MRLSKAFLLSFLIFFLADRSSIRAQESFGFVMWDNIPLKMNGLTVLNPWAGGINNAQFGRIDLNGDGLMDLIVFDRHGNRLMPFLFERSGSEWHYVYSPFFRRFFPPLSHWFQLLDYNGDGKTDLFTYTPGGIMVYRNDGDDVPDFRQITHPYITSLQGSIYTNLLVTYVDYPAIADLDGDGDMDILTFWGLGSFVEFHRNMSVETFGSPDSLIFEKVSNCWGRFAENPESNIIYLDTCSGRTVTGALNDTPKHTGSTFCLLDINGDQLLDLLLGDVDYPDFSALINGGSDNVNAVMTAQLPAYPAEDPALMWSFPLAWVSDIDNSGRNELLVSPFDPSLVKSEGSESVWLYRDASATSTPEFVLERRDFLQHTMVDLGLGAHPVFADVDGDGLVDMVAGNYGLYDTCIVNDYGQLKCYYYSRLALFLNRGTALQPSFELYDDDFALVSALQIQGAYPAFMDLDGDGDTDMVLGSDDGTLRLFINLAGEGNLPVYAAPGQNAFGIDAGAYSTPVFFDVDADGLNDLVLGNAAGKLWLYRNTGSVHNPVFQLVSDFWGGVNVTDPMVSYTGYAVPSFIRAPDGTPLLLVGSESGLMSLYGGVSAEPGSQFTLLARHFMYISEGIRTSPAVTDLNNDGYPDLAVGNYSGGITLFRGTAPGPEGIVAEPDTDDTFRIFPNPASETLTVLFSRQGRHTARIFDLNGRMIKEIPAVGTASVTVGVEDLPAGIYIISVCSLERQWEASRQKFSVIR